MDSQTIFEQIYQQYYRLMYRIAFDLLHDPTNTEDALQEAFLRIARNMNKISDPFCPKTKNFVVIITRNVAFSMLKKRKGIIPANNL